MDEYKKHAYLLIVHKNIDQVVLLIRLIDDYRNDIFIHIDKKSHWSDIERTKIKDSASYSNVYFIESKSITWGGFSIVSVELDLLDAAISKCKYEYYHLLSGQDLPIKSQNYIHDFFKQNKNKEFIQFGSYEWNEKVSKRIKYYWIFQEIAGRSKRIDKRILRAADRISIFIQSRLGINRIHGYKFSAGHQWFSITDDFARYIISQRKYVYKHFKLTYCSDECFVAFLAENSRFINNIYLPEKINNGLSSNVRLIDWKRGSPYIYCNNDYNEINESRCLFARKFDINKDYEIIEKIYNNLKGIPK